MAEDKKLVEAITSMDVDFAQWYTDVVKKAELIDYTSVKGCMVIKPAYGSWMLLCKGVGEIEVFAVVKRNLNAAEDIDDLGEGVEVYNNVIVDGDIEVVLQNVDKSSCALTYCTGAGKERIDLCISAKLGVLYYRVSLEGGKNDAL